MIRQRGSYATKHSPAFVKPNNERIKTSMGHCLGVRYYVNSSQTWWRLGRGVTLTLQWGIVWASGSMSIGPRHCGDMNGHDWLLTHDALLDICVRRSSCSFRGWRLRSVHRNLSECYVSLGISDE